ncbi:MAG: helix-turn-helix domain-containing protein [Coriobacteriales bacterium]
MVDALEIGYAIKDRRGELGLTQAQLAQEAGVSKRCLWSLELGQNPGVQLDKLTAVLGALGLDLVIAPAGNAGAAKAPLAADAAPQEQPAVPSPSTEAATSSPSSASPAPGAIDALAILTGASR